MCLSRLKDTEEGSLRGHPESQGSQDKWLRTGWCSASDEKWQDSHFVVETAGFGDGLNVKQERAVRRDTMGLGLRTRYRGVSVTQMKKTHGKADLRAELAGVTGMWSSDAYQIYKWIWM